jgi:hypothetical protein
MDSPDITFSPCTIGQKPPKVRCPPTSRLLRAYGRGDFLRPTPARGAARERTYATYLALVHGPVDRLQGAGSAGRILLADLPTDVTCQCRFQQLSRSV